MPSQTKHMVDNKNQIHSSPNTLNSSMGKKVLLLAVLDSAPHAKLIVQYGNTG